MRKLTALVVLIAAIPISASAETFSACWTERVFDPVRLVETQVTVCRIAGGDVVEYADDSSVPSTLYPNLGTDLTGQCWYYTSAPTDYVILVQFGDGSAEIGFDTDPGVPGGIIAIGPTLPRCTSEPVPAADPRADAWEYVMAYIHDPPAPDLSPAPGHGVTGMETYVGVEVPADHDATLSSGATSLDVEIDVSAVIVRWGDGTDSTYPPTDEVLIGYPDGSATHVYEHKAEHDITVEYDWTARWRVSGGSWEFLPVPNTTTSLAYPVAEVVSRLDG